MPVLDKISKIVIHWEEEISTDPIDTYYPRTFGMLNQETRNPMVRINGLQVFEAPTLIEAIWIAVVDFIKGYALQINSNGK